MAPRFLGYLLSGLLVSISFGGREALAATRYLSPSTGIDQGDCTNSAAPCLTFAYLATSLGDGDTIEVAGGRVRASISLGSTSLLHLTIRGGWDAAFTARNPGANRTTLRPERAPGGGTYSAFSIAAAAPAESAHLVLDGLTITGTKRAPAIDAVATNGGAIQIDVDKVTLKGNSNLDPGVVYVDASVVLAKADPNGSSIGISAVDSVFEANRSTSSVMFLARADASFSGCTFRRNRSTKSNAAIAQMQAALHVEASSFEKNRGKRPAGGRYAYCAVLSGAATIVDSTFAKNVGGGICGQASITGTEIRDTVGAAIFGHIGATTVTRTLITGGKLLPAILASKPVTLVNTVIANNRRAGVSCNSQNGALIAVNSTITGNGGGIDGASVEFGAPWSLTNTIVWGNTGYDLRPSGSVDAGTSDLGVVDLSVGGPLNDLGGNVSADPLLADGVHLLPGSPAIDAGTCSGIPADDIDGEPRPNGVSCDIGADEF